MAGQIAYHLLAQAGATGHRGKSPRGVLPAVLVLGMGAALAHLLHADACADGQADPEPKPPPGSRAGGLLNVAGRLAEAEAAARQLAAAGQGISRRALRRAGLHGSNADLERLAAMIRARSPLVSDEYAEWFTGLIRRIRVGAQVVRRSRSAGGGPTPGRPLRAG